MSWYKSDAQCRREGERAFERNRYGRHDRNPYPDGAYDDRRHHRAWDDGFRSAERRDEDRRAEEATEEARARQRAHDIEMQRREQEAAYWAEQEALREEEIMAEDWEEAQEAPSDG